MPYRGDLEAQRARCAILEAELAELRSRVSTLTALVRALTKARVEFIPADQKGEGVRLRDPRA